MPTRNRFAGIFLMGAALLCGPAKGAESSSPELHWYRCNTHTHTSAPPNSDANETPEFVAEWYRTHGYQCLVITDHEFMTDVKPLNEKYGKKGEFLVLSGQEITQVVADASHPGGLRHAHVNGIETNRLILPIRPELKGPSSAMTPAQQVQAMAATNVTLEETYRRNVAEIRAAGGLVQINHPNRLWSVRFQDMVSLPEPFLLEIWNPASSSNNLGGTDDSGNTAPSVEGMWDELLSRGKIVWGVAADDAHTYHQFDRSESPNPGRAWVVVRAPELSKTAIVQALTSGNFYASTGVQLESYDVDAKAIGIKLRPLGQWSPKLTPSTRYVTRFVGNDGRVLSEVPGMTARYVFRGDEKYVRASIIDSDGRRAWTQPVFLDRK